ncbi:hypothetical protein BGZ74_002363, partial [Mortierella antarctica]
MDVEEACVHLLMLNWPTRSDCGRWKAEQNMDSFFALARNVLDADIFNSIVQPLEDIQAEGMFGGIEDGIQLDPTQQQLVNRLSLGQPTFVQGSAGTGKSTVIWSLVREIRAEGIYEPVVLAPSGVAAKNV